MAVSKIMNNRSQIYWWLAIAIMVISITILHYTTPTMLWQYHLIFMQSYFIPILVAAFRFGISGGLGTALAVSCLYLPHVMLQWGGLIEANLMRFLQIILFNVVGFVTGLLAQREMREKERFQYTARELEINLKKLHHQSDKLMRLEEQLRQYDRLAVVGALAASLAHEVRNPLGSIRGAVEILRDALPLKARKSEFLQILIDETERLNRVVENYLNFSGPKKQEDKKYDVREVMQNANMMLANNLAKQGIQLIPHLPELPLYVKGDSNQLWQILMNLLINAYQAMDKGGTITMAAQYLEKSSQNEMGKDSQETVHPIRINIRDQGRGISPDDMKKIFKPFYSTKADGTGLGLAIVKRICDENRWEIQVQSTPDQGTEVQLILAGTD